jgi:hypothetical protein
MENLDPALLASLDPRALEQLLQGMAASMPKTEQLCKGFTPSDDLKKKEAAMHESKAAYDNQLSEVMKTLSKLQAVPDRQKASLAAAQAQSSERLKKATADAISDVKASAAAAEARALQEGKAEFRRLQNERRKNFDEAFATNDVVDPSIKLKLDHALVDHRAILEKIFEGGDALETLESFTQKRPSALKVASYIQGGTCVVLKTRDLGAVSIAIAKKCDEVIVVDPDPSQLGTILAAGAVARVLLTPRCNLVFEWLDSAEPVDGCCIDEDHPDDCIELLRELIYRNLLKLDARVVYAPCMAFTKSCGEVFEFLERHKRFSDVSHADGIVAATYIGGDSVVAVPLSKCGEDVHIEPPPRRAVVGPLPEGVELPDTDYDPGKERRAAVAHLEETYEAARRELGNDHPVVARAAAALAAARATGAELEYLVP